MLRFSGASGMAFAKKKALLLLQVWGGIGRSDFTPLALESVFTVQAATRRDSAKNPQQRAR
jgi:hypothetical protein